MRRFLVPAAAVAALVLPHAALASCGTPPPPLPYSTVSARPYVDRFNALVARDPYLLKEAMAPAWRVLIADLRKDPAPPPDLLTRSLAKLASSLQGDEGSDEALAAAREAERLVVAGGLGDSPLHAETLWVLATKETNAGKAADAAAHAAAALASATEHFGTQSWEVGRAEMAASSAANALGHYGEAEHFADIAEQLAIRCLASDDPRIVRRISSHAAILGMAGRLEQSLAENEAAASWALDHLHEDDDGMLLVLDNFGMALRNASRLLEAEAVLRRAVDLGARYHRNDWYDRSLSTAKFANVLEAEGYHREAEAMWTQSEQFLDKTSDKRNPIGAGGAWRRSADAAQARGDLVLALSRRQEAIRLMALDASPQHPELARARIEYASTLLLAGRPADAGAVAQPAIALLRAGMTETDPKRMAAEIINARIEAALAGPEVGYGLADVVTSRLEKTLLDTATSRGDVIRYEPLFSPSFAAMTLFALETHREEAAFHALQLTNLSEIVLVSTDVAARAAAGSSKAGGLAKSLQEQGYERQRLDRERSFAVSKHDSARLAELNAAIAAADAAIATASRQLDTEFPAFRSLGRPVPITLAQYQARLTRDDVLIAPVRLSGETVTIAITHDQFFWARSATPSWRLTSLISRIRASIDASRTSGSKLMPFDADAARQLYRVIVPPALEPVLKSHRHLYYYASGGLASLPPALLVTGPAGRGGRQPWLIRTHSISVVPTLAAAPTPSDAIDPGAGFLGVGAPALGPSLPAISSRSVAVRLGSFGDRPLALLPSLPFAARELRQMGSLFEPLHRKLLLDRAATEAAIKTDPLARYKVIAIATHGLVNGALPGLAEPALVLTPPATPSAMDDGLLTASEVTNLHLDADWVILSACDSASGREPAGASYSGLASAFMEAGARALLVSHWPVRDDAASGITVATLRATRNGTDRATALQRAMIALMDDRSVSGSANPAIWAPFVLVER